MSRRRRYIIFAGKIVLAVLLIGWLLRTGALDLGALRVLGEDPLLLAATLATFLVSTAFGALRWRLLLQLVGVPLSASRALQLQLISVFFNVVGAGNLGGDVIKSVYVARDVSPAKRPTVFLIALVDRLIAVAGLVLIAVAAVIVRGRAMWDAPELRTLALIVVTIAGASVIGGIVLVVLLRRSTTTPRVRTSRIAKLFDQLLEAVRRVIEHPRGLAIALALSLAACFAGMTLFALLTSAITQRDVSFGTIATIYPIGMLTLLIPISPAGIGVAGYVAFERLFILVGLEQGATVFNVYTVGLLAPCLLGAIPYLALRREAAPPTEAEAEAHAQNGKTTYDGADANG